MWWFFRCTNQRNVYIMYFIYIYIYTLLYINTAPLLTQHFTQCMYMFRCVASERSRFTDTTAESWLFVDFFLRSRCLLSLSLSMFLKHVLLICLITIHKTPFAVYIHIFVVGGVKNHIDVGNSHTHIQRQ